MGRMRLAATVAGGVLVVLPLLSACGEAAVPPADSPSAPVTRTPVPTVTGWPETPGPPTARVTPSPRTSRPATLTLTGMVEHADVGGGCLVLRTAERTYVLVGEAARHLRVGSSVTVTGHEATNRMTTCQAGRPFEVGSVKSP